MLLIFVWILVASWKLCIKLTLWASHHIFVSSCGLASSNFCFCACLEWRKTTLCKLKFSGVSYLKCLIVINFKVSRWEFFFLYLSSDDVFLLNYVCSFFRKLSSTDWGVWNKLLPHFNWLLLIFLILLLSLLSAALQEGWGE